MITHQKKLTYLLLVFTLIQSTLQQPQQPTPNLQNPTSAPQIIQFKDNTLQPTHIDFIQPHYTYYPEIAEDYSIVHTLLYPLANSPASKFAPTLPKDSFVQKLNPKHSLPPQEVEKRAEDILKKQTIEQQAKLKEQHSLPPQEVGKRAEDILKKQTIEQQAKLKEQKQTTQTPSNSPTQNRPKQIKSDQKATSQQKVEPPIPQKIKSKSKQSTLKPQQKPQAPEVNLLASIGQNKPPQVPQDKKQIKFKEHQVAKPLTITNYPFEGTKQIQNPKSTKQQPMKPTEPQNERKQEPRKGENLQKQSKEKENAQSLDPSAVQQFKQLTKQLSIPPQTIKHTLEFESLVKQQIQESDWKLLIIKLVICLTILIAIYQATCSSESQQNKIEKGKYSPLGVNELDTENSLDMTEKTENR